MWQQSGCAGEGVKVVVLADTHTRGRSRMLPSGAWPYIESADHILHAGDVTDPALLDELKSLAPLSVVLGNCDGFEVKEWGATEVCEMELDGVRVAMLHDSGPSRRRRERMRARFP
ncbi:MAG TPA: metallophosphoesterase family protein, partial [Actinomycetota bacterium]|nr:metallophosphoesterase family protein [Actinomycetota bacterium]